MSTFQPLTNVTSPAIATPLAASLRISSRSAISSEARSSSTPLAG